MRTRVLSVVLALWAGAAAAQPVTVVGPVTPGNIPQFNSQTVIKDSGFPASGTVVGPGVSVVGDCVTWANLLGTLLADTACLQIFGTVTAHTFLAGPVSGSAAFPTFRAIIGADLPLLGSTVTLGGITLGLGSDATGDIYYNNAGILTRLPIGSTNNVLTVVAGKPGWSAAGSGNVSNVGTPTANQLAIWTGATTIEGVTATAHAIIVGEGASAPAYVGPGTVGQFDAAQGASADPAFVSGPWTLLATLTASNSATLSDTTHFTSAYTEYEIRFTNLLPATNNVNVEIQVHSGGSFQATSYLTTAFGAAGSATINFFSPTTFIPLNTLGVNNTGAGRSGFVRVAAVSQTSVAKIFNGISGYESSSSWATNTVSGFWNSTAAVDGFQFLFSSGNITSGTIEIYGRL
jgi:hypothetical protein